MEAPIFNPIEYIKTLPEMNRDFVHFLFYFLRATHPIVRELTEQKFPKLRGSDVPLTSLLQEIIEHKHNSDDELKTLLIDFNEECRERILAVQKASQSEPIIIDSNPVEHRNSTPETVIETVWSPNHLRDSVEKLPPSNISKIPLISIPIPTPKFNSRASSSSSIAPNLKEVASNCQVISLKQTETQGEKCFPTSPFPPRKRIRVEEADLHILEYNYLRKQLKCECGKITSSFSLRVDHRKSVLCFSNVCDTQRDIAVLTRDKEIIATVKSFTGFILPSKKALTEATDFCFDGHCLYNEGFIINNVAQVRFIKQEFVISIIDLVEKYLQSKSAL